jgi:hypothetical protein
MDVGFRHKFSNQNSNSYHHGLKINNNICKSFFKNKKNVYQCIKK